MKLHTHGDKISQGDTSWECEWMTPCGDLLKTNKVTCDETTVSIINNFVCCHNQDRCEETTISNNTDYDWLQTQLNTVLLQPKGTATHNVLLGPWCITVMFRNNRVMQKWKWMVQHSQGSVVQWASYGLNSGEDVA